MSQSVDRLSGMVIAVAGINRAMPIHFIDIGTVCRSHRNREGDHEFTCSGS